MYQKCCNKCGSTSLHTEQKGNNIGLYCDDCGHWIKWLGKDELRAFEHSQKQNKKEHKEINLDKLEEILCRYFNVPDDTYAYNLTRVKEGFAVGTVTLDDFVEFDEEVIGDLANYIREHLEND